ncbi:peroxiredoxin [Candidatus Entotheonella serta]|nr:peroxiredoxin [Candidatus Entotheonella serta]
MAGKTHSYQIKLRWTGNTGAGTSGYRAYERAHEISAPGKLPILGSSDPAFRGDAVRYNPEELLVASLAACHMLWYLHLCADHGIVVTGYTDQPRGQMLEAEDGGGRFTEVILQPLVTVRAGADLVLAEQLHERAHALCFIANSMNFPVRRVSVIQEESTQEKNND